MQSIYESMSIEQLRVAYKNPKIAEWEKELIANIGKAKKNEKAS